MALSKTDRGKFSRSGNNTLNTLAATAFTPAAGCILVVPAGIIVSAGGALSLADTFSDGGTWVEQITTAAGSYVTRSSIFTKVVGASPASGVITLTRTAGDEDYAIAMHILEISGQHATTPVRQSKANNGTATTLTVTLDSLPLTDSYVFGTVMVDAETNGITPGANYTEISEDLFGGWGGGYQAEEDLTPTATAVNWSALATANNRGTAIEIAAAAAGGLKVNPFSGRGGGASQALVI